MTIWSILGLYDFSIVSFLFEVYMDNSLFSHKPIFTDFTRAKSVLAQGYNFHKAGYFHKALNLSIMLSNLTCQTLAIEICQELLKKKLKWFWDTGN